MGSIKVVLQGKTVNKLNGLLDQFETERNLGGILRILAIKGLAAGDSVERIADNLRSSEQTVRNWINDFLILGIRSIFQKKSPGRPKILTDYETGILKKILQNPPEKHGFLGGCWDAKKIRHLLVERFGKTLSVKYIPEILKSIGLSFRKARVEFGNKDDVLRGIWVEKTWPKILVTAEKQDAHIFFGDEAFFSVFGTTVLEGDESGRTWYLWGFTAGGASYFEIHNTRSGEVAAKFLAESQCLFLMSDVYSGYIRAVREANV